MNVLKTPAGKAMAGFLVLVVILLFAFWPRGSAPSSMPVPDASGARGVTDEKVPDEMLAQARTDAALAPCPSSSAPVPAGAALAGVRAVCLADGTPIDLGAATAGRPTVINLWAVWCLPCRRELPLFDELYRRAGSQVDVLAVHARDGGDKPYAILSFLAELGVHLPTVADTDGAVARALRAPRIFPSTVLVRADGTVAAVLPQVFADYAELAGAVQRELGVDVSGGGA